MCFQGRGKEACQQTSYCQCFLLEEEKEGCCAYSLALC